MYFSYFDDRVESNKLLSKVQVSVGGFRTSRSFFGIRVYMLYNSRETPVLVSNFKLKKYNVSNTIP